MTNTELQILTSDNIRLLNKPNVNWVNLKRAKDFFEKLNKLAPDQPMQEQPEIPQLQGRPRQIEYKFVDATTE